MARVKEKALTLEEKLAQALVPVEEQPYEVPENWCWCRLSEAISTSKEKTEVFSDPSVKYIGLEHMERNRGIVSYGSPEGIKSSKNVFHDGQILYGKLRPYLNKHGIASFDGICSTDILVFDSLATTIPQYADYYLNLDFFIQYVVANSKGINLPRVSESTVLDAVYPLPPLPEQHRIVEHIERLFAQLDQAKEKAHAVIDGYEDRRASILHRAFTGELTEEWRQDQRISFDSWIVKPLCDLCDRIFDGPFGSNLKSDDYVEKGIRVVRLENLKNLWFDDSKKSFVTEEKYSSISGHTVYPTDLIMATFIADEIKICQMPEYIGYAVNKADCIGIRVSNGTDKRFVLYYLSSKQTFNHLFNQLHGATRPRVNTKQIKAIPVPLPTLAEQAEIVRILDSLLSKESAAKSLAERAIAQIDATKQSILARAFRGELGTNDPEDEPAIELLKRTLETRA